MYIILCPVVWSKPFSSGIGLLLCIYHFTGLEDNFSGSRTPPSLRQSLGLPPLCAFSLWFYDRSARLNSFFTYVKYITLHYLLYGYKRHIRKVSTNISVMTNNEKAKVMRSTQCVRDCTIWDEAQLVAASPRESPLCLNRTWSNSAILIIKMIGIIQNLYLKQRSVDTY